MAKKSLRERNKEIKLQRIKSSAEQLFREEGFDATTTRKIAQRADVGLSTLFLYASDKRDLLFLVCNDELEKLAVSAFSDVQSDSPLLDQLTVAFRHFFIHYAKNKQISRDLLRELTFYNTGINSQRFQQIREENVLQIGKIIRAAKERGQIATEADESIVARMIFYILAAELRRWLSIDGATPESGVQGTREMLEILVRGLEPTT